MPPKKTATPAKGAAAKKTTTSKGKSPSKPAAGGAAAAAPEPVAAPLMGTSIGLKALVKSLFDPSNELGQSGRWAFVCDPSENSTTFLRYRDVNMLNVINASDMDAERIRLAILGGLRYGKPAVVDFMQSNLTEMWPKVVEYFNAVKPGLMDNILNKEILKEEYYLSLITDKDDTCYSQYNFTEDLLKNFAFIAVCANTDVPKGIAQKFYTVTVE